MVTILLFIPDTFPETIFSIFALFITCGMFGYALNTIGMIMTDINKKKKHKKLERDMVNRFLE